MNDAASTLEIGAIAMGLFGGIALFLAGMEQMSQALASGERIEIRGFGSFSLHYRPPRLGRNPKTGDSVALSGKYVPHFKPGKELRERVDKVHSPEMAEEAQASSSS